LTKSYATESKKMYYGRSPNFGGHYILIEIGDGSESKAVIADINTGKIYDTPDNYGDDFLYSNDVYYCIKQNAIHNEKYSNLLVINKGGYYNEDKTVNRNYYLWNDKTKTFKKIKSENQKCLKESEINY